MYESILFFDKIYSYLPASKLDLCSPKTGIFRNHHSKHFSYDKKTNWTEIKISILITSNGIKQIQKTYNVQGITQTAYSSRGNLLMDKKYRTDG